MTELDTTGLTCPLPVLRARKALQDLARGDKLQVTATDPTSVHDFPSFCHAGGHILINATEEDGVFTFLIEKGKVPEEVKAAAG